MTGASTDFHAEQGYAAILAAVMETTHGRWFLAEYARRNRAADTDLLLGAVAWIERRLGGESRPSDGETAGAQGLAAAFAESRRALAGLVGAAERIQEVSWTLREAGHDEVCDRLDEATAEIASACARQSAAQKQAEALARPFESGPFAGAVETLATEDIAWREDAPAGTAPDDANDEGVVFTEAAAEAVGPAEPELPFAAEAPEGRPAAGLGDGWFVRQLFPEAFEGDPIEREAPPERYRLFG